MLAHEPIPTNPRFKDLTGQRFGRLLVLSYEGRGPGQSLWHAQCDCGRDTICGGANLRAGTTRSCGCIHREFVSELGRRSAKHGEFSGGQKPSRSKEYNIWRGIVSRCTVPGSKYWPFYGGRGIAVCERWRGGFEAFLADVGRSPGPEYSLDRIDNDKGYEPGNVRWATHREQARNRRGNRFVTYRGARMTVAEAVDRSGVRYATALRRLKLGWSEEDTFEQPTRYWRRAPRRPPCEDRSA
jgi:hypothetical protein